jgi:hypothetical protein
MWLPGNIAMDGGMEGHMAGSTYTDISSVALLCGRLMRFWAKLFSRLRVARIGMRRFNRFTACIRLNA